MSKDLTQIFDNEDGGRIDGENVCPACGNEIDLTDFIDEMARMNYDTSGLCQPCQNDIFCDSFNGDDIL